MPCAAALIAIGREAGSNIGSVSRTTACRSQLASAARFSGLSPESTDSATVVARAAGSLFTSVLSSFGKLTSRCGSRDATLRKESARPSTVEVAAGISETASPVTSPAAGEKRAGSSGSATGAAPSARAAMRFKKFVMSPPFPGKPGDAPRSSPGCPARASRRFAPAYPLPAANAAPAR